MEHAREEAPAAAWVLAAAILLSATALLAIQPGILPVDSDFGCTGPVIIYHTHARETYPQAPDSRAGDDLSILTVGTRLALALEERGLEVVHSRRRHDVPTEEAAYDRSRQTAAALLSRYHQPPLIIDLHRDAPGRSQTVGYNRSGEATARLLFVIGGHSRSAHNEGLAARLMLDLIQREPDLNRGLRHLSYHYHQDLSPNLLLVELGGADTYDAEALRGMEVLADVIAGVLCGDAGDL